MNYYNAPRRGLNQSQATLQQNLLIFGRVVLEICVWTDRQTDSQTRSSQYYAASLERVTNDYERIGAT